MSIVGFRNVLISEEPMLNKKKIAYFKKLLTQRRDELLADASNSVVAWTEPKEESPDLVDQASRESDRDLTLRMRERESRLLAKIEDALARLEMGGFGICEECGEEIAEKRLKARPITTLCIQCKQEQEVKERRRGL
jgi:DnaK suppressor protein